MNSRINNTKKALQNIQLKVVEVTIGKFSYGKRSAERRKKNKKDNI